MTTRTVTLKPVRSSALHAHGYDAPSRTFIVALTSGRTLKYRGVPPDVVEAFAKDDSPGRAFGALIRGKFPHEYVANGDTFHFSSQPANEQDQA